MKMGLSLLRERYEVVVPPSIGRKSGYLAGDDGERVAEMNEALRDPSIRGIVMARGGYGLTRILHLLDGAALRRDPIRIMGFSDGTALLHWANSQGVASVHGPVVTQVGKLDEESKEKFVDVWSESPQQDDVPKWGGNLCLLSHLVGTDYFLPPSEYQLFIEDIGELPYALDRGVTHLHASGVLTGCVSALLGEFWSRDGKHNYRQAVAARLAELGIESSHVPIGHGSANRPVWQGI